MDKATPRVGRRSSTVCVLPAVLLCAIGSASAQTSSPVESGPPAPTPEKAEPPPQTPTPDPQTDGFRVGSFVFRPGGRIKLDIIRDFDPIGSEDSFDTRTIPVDGSDGINSNIHARETRLSLDIRGPAEGRELRMYVETDFYGSGNVLRLRHAFGSYGGLMAGQTWSTFVDEANIPNTIDFEAPTAFALIRQAQARWTQRLSAHASWSVAVEDNKSSIVPPTGVPGKAEYPLPDLVTRVRFDGRARTPVGRGLSRQGELPADPGRPGQRDAVGRTSLGTSEDVRP